MEHLQGATSVWQIICASALNLFHTICEQIESGEITVNDLKIVESKSIQVVKLSEAISSSKIPSCPTPDVIMQNMEKRLKEYKYFTDFNKKFTFVLEKISGEGVTIKG